MQATVEFCLLLVEVKEDGMLVGFMQCNSMCQRYMQFFRSLWIPLSPFKSFWVYINIIIINIIILLIHFLSFIFGSGLGRIVEIVLDVMGSV